MAETVDMPVTIRIGDQPDRLIATIHTSWWPTAGRHIAAALREAADAIEADADEDANRVARAKYVRKVKRGGR